MRNAYYVLFNLAVCVPTAVLSLRTDVKPHRAWRSFLLALLVVSLPFVAWDVWAVSAGHWAFNPTYVFGSRVWGLPLEEIMFFATVPFAMMYVWGVVQKHASERIITSPAPYITLGLLLAVGLFGLSQYWSLGYTRSACFMLIVAIFLLCCSRLVFLRTFWIFQLLLLVLFIGANSVLTALPIITYGDHAIIGLRLGTIPLEDFIYNFAFLNLFLLVYEWFTWTIDKKLNK